MSKNTLTPVTWTREDEATHRADAVVIARNAASGLPSSRWLLDEFRALDNRRLAHDEARRQQTDTAPVFNLDIELLTGSEA